MFSTSLLRLAWGCAALTAMAGCAMPSDDAKHLAAENTRSPTAEVAAPPSQNESKDRNESKETVKSETTAGTVKLPAYEVRESAISDFGISVRTNFEVKWAGKIEWMRVSAVSASSSAAHAGLAPGDQILAIDGQLITEMDKATMLDALFQRKKGDSCRLLILGQNDSLPRFVTLIANRAGS
jgi:C-terminal processing protease CtpA/Prc